MSPGVRGWSRWSLVDVDKSVGGGSGGSGIDRSIVDDGQKENPCGYFPTRAAGEGWSRVGISNPYPPRWQPAPPNPRVCPTHDFPYPLIANSSRLSSSSFFTFSLSSIMSDTVCKECSLWVLGQLDETQQAQMSPGKDGGKNLEKGRLVKE